ncbi:MAG: putative flagellar basal-body rod protein FlgC-like [Alphaproteobacteria bacterium]|nr:putative flagellar basal-body rod protein FlgC-like [Alphaproteobacteria bacterium]
MNAIGIALSGVQASVVRLDASASNIANLNSIGTLGAGQVGNAPYQPVEVSQWSVAGGGVATLAGTRRPSTFPLYDPSSMSADESGMMASPDVDLVSETAAQIEALCAYRANLSVIRTADQMEGSLLDLTA